jgi:hypothetical protein
VDEEYATISFPYTEIKTPDLFSEYEWKFEHVTGYINTWSSVQHFIEKNKKNPVDRIIHPLKKAWGNEQKRKVSFPIFMRLAENKK